MSQQQGPRHRGTIVLLLFATLMIVSIPAMAAKGGNGGGKGQHGSGGGTSGTSTIDWYLMNSTDGVVNYGDQVSFTVSTTATQYPYVHLQCWQNGSLVLESWQGFFPTAMGHQWFYLGPTNVWQSGEADCTGNLEKYSSKGAWEKLASTSFHVNP